MRVWPNDIDLNFHLNNARLLARTGILTHIVRKRWQPLVGAVWITYRRSLPVFSAFDLTSRLVCWNERWFYIEQTFTGKEGLTFPLLSDPAREVLRAYGAYGEKMMYGKKSVGVIRSTFVVGADGRIEHAYYGVKATGHVARLRKDLGV